MVTPKFKVLSQNLLQGTKGNLAVQSIYCPRFKLGTSTYMSDILSFEPVCSVNTSAIQWETRKVVSKIACTTDFIVCTICEGGDLELPIDGVGTHRNLGNSSIRCQCPCNSALNKSSEVL